MAQGGLASLILFNLHVNDMPAPSPHVQLGPHADDRAVIVTCHQPTLLVTGYSTRSLAIALVDSHQHLEGHRGHVVRYTARHLGSTLINEVPRKAAQSLGILAPVRNRGSALVY